MRFMLLININYLANKIKSSVFDRFHQNNNSNTHHSKPKERFARIRLAKVDGAAVYINILIAEARETYLETISLARQINREHLHPENDRKLNLCSLERQNLTSPSSS